MAELSKEIENAFFKRGTLELTPKIWKTTKGKVGAVAVQVSIL